MSWAVLEENLAGVVIEHNFVLTGPSDRNEWWCLVRLVGMSVVAHIPFNWLVRHGSCGKGIEYKHLAKMSEYRLRNP